MLLFYLREATITFADCSYRFDAKPLKTKHLGYPEARARGGVNPERGGVEAARKFATFLTQSWQ